MRRNHTPDLTGVIITACTLIGQAIGRRIADRQAEDCRRKAEARFILATPVDRLADLHAAGAIAL